MDLPIRLCLHMPRIQEAKNRMLTINEIDSLNLSSESREESTDEDQEEDFHDVELISGDFHSEEGENENLGDIQRLHPKMRKPS